MAETTETGTDEHFIADYLGAFCAVNPGAALPSISRRGPGWWGIRSAGSAYTSPKRRRDIIEMTARLLARSVLAPKEPDNG